jgi:hypothetical protein
LTRLAIELREPTGTQFLAAIITTSDLDPRIAGLRDDLMNRTMATLATMLDRFGDSTTGSRVDPQFLLTQLIGPLIVQVSIMRNQVGRDFIDRVIDEALPGNAR